MPDKKNAVHFFPDIPVCHTLITTSFYRRIPVREKEKSESEVTLLGLTLVKISASSYSHAQPLLRGKHEAGVKIYVLLSKGLKMSESKTVGKRGTWCVLVSSLHSQVNSRNHFCARRINTFRKPSQWFIHWRTCWWQLELLQCHSHWKGHQLRWWRPELFPSSACWGGGLTPAPASCTHARAPTCLPVKGCSLWEANLQHRSAVPAPWHIKYMVAGISQIFLSFLSVWDFEQWLSWMLNFKTGLHICSRRISLGNMKDILPTLGRRSQHS